MTRALGVAVLWLMLSPAQAWEQSGIGSAEQTPTPTPPPTAPLAGSASAIPPVTEAPGETSPVDSALRAQIQDALDKDPIFSQGHLKVTVRADGIELSGDLASGRDRQNAGRMAQSYARGKKVLNHIVVRRRSAQPGAGPPENPPANFSIPARNPESGRNNPP